ncbi:hypothetical protein FJT64_002116 [Amphibalanus amphitrite]|uniref:Uncharacterized protein n=1 Tax=Amphibalanus amphitrite TaxID=1232801 RepID=A0A6A4X354_AMPAM|nr:hypothetical protein FJT64_002116 [Amphibalanus amphitrite]
MASWCVVLMAVPYEDVLLLLRTVPVRATAVQHKPATTPPDVQMAAGSKPPVSSAVSGPHAGLPDLLQSVPRPVPSSAVSTDSGSGPRRAGPAAEADEARLSTTEAPSSYREGVSEQTLARCGAQLRRVADQLHRAHQPADRIWRRLEARLDLQHVLWTSLAVHMAYTAMKVST